ncbi:heparan sulfate glucosamine 3-O-sulfotransferase 1-like [Ptychodera flava]|uniref:heparan sulfate glucosamine 3-O-sulfotransferase 1-like n=1 Tax=Ptychodera flava TaxID=63121 RepID=UPI00396A21C0
MVSQLTLKSIGFVLVSLAIAIFVYFTLIPIGRPLSFTSHRSESKMNGGREGSSVSVNKFGKVGRVYNQNDKLKRHIPQAMIVGIKKCGTGPLRSFLNFHPSVVARDLEVHYFDRYYANGIDWYIQQMPPARDDQITVEKTPRYFVEPDVPGKIYKEFSPKTKIIIVACEPTKRAISDYVHTYKHTINAERTIQRKAHNSEKYQKEKTRLERYFKAGYLVNDTFESTILDANGNINENSAVVENGIYVKYLRNWLNVFPLTQIHVVDGEIFKSNPAREMVKLQSFLDIEPFFFEDSFYFDKEKGFFCLKRPERYCLGKNKGRTHPDIDKNAFNALAEYYKPFNKDFSRVLNQSFSWIS